MKKRAGFTLIEICTVIVVLSVVLTIGASVVHALLDVNRAARQGLADQVARGRLAETFRGDVHASDDFRAVSDAEDNSAAVGWELKQADGAAIVYRLEEDRLVRSMKTPATATHESFALAKGTTVTIEEHRQGEVRLLRLVVRCGAAEHGGASRRAVGLRVEAHLARDRALSEVPTQAAERQEEPPDE